MTSDPWVPTWGWMSKTSTPLKNAFLFFSVMQIHVSNQPFVRKSYLDNLYHSWLASTPQIQTFGYKRSKHRTSLDFFMIFLFFKNHSYLNTVQFRADFLSDFRLQYGARGQHLGHLYKVLFYFSDLCRYLTIYL